MRFPQVLDLNLDTVIAIDGYNVINNETQEPLGILNTPIKVDIRLWSVRDDSYHVLSDIEMTYLLEVDHWKINVADIASALTDRHKYVGKVSENSGSDENMRDFKLIEFSVDNDGVGATTMRLPYELKVTESDAYFIWYSDGHIGDVDYAEYKAKAFEGGVGTTYAKDVNRVTHRGAVVKYS